MKKEEVEKVRLFKKLENDLVCCQACSWRCLIAPGKRGICGVRQNLGGELFLLVSNRAGGGLAVDPVEKKPLFHFLPGSTALSFGTLGCNFSCLFCSNAWLSQAPQKVKKEEDLEDLIKRLSLNLNPGQIVKAALDSDSESIAYTYNEPTIFAEFAYRVMKSAGKKGLKNIWVSNGFESKESFDLIKNYLNAVNFDLKSFNPQFYEKICQGKLKPVLKNIERFLKFGIWTEVTTLIIPGENDSLKELKQIAGFLKSLSVNIPWHISAFSPAYKMNNKPPTSLKKLIEAWEIGKAAGLNFVYLGNVWDLADNKYFSTFCPNCGSLIIERDALRKVEIVGLRKEKCKSCRRKISGVWPQKDYS